jgi:hypothetical protein
VPCECPGGRGQAVFFEPDPLLSELLAGLELLEVSELEEPSEDPFEALVDDSLDAVVFSSEPFLVLPFPREEERLSLR